MEVNAKTVRRVSPQQRVLNANHFADGLAGSLLSQRFGFRSDDNCRDLLGGRKPVRRCERLPAQPAYLPAALLQHQQNSHRTLASILSFSTSAVAASLAEPDRICVFFCLFGAETRSRVTTGAASCPNSAAFTLRSSLVLARLMPIRVE